MSDLHLLHESKVLDSEIDSLGHMNVRYYLSRVDAANLRLLDAVGLDAKALPPAGSHRLRRADTYSRFHREQFSGAVLETHGGLLAPQPNSVDPLLRAYYEIRNPATQQLAASFIVATGVLNSAEQQLITLPSLDQATLQRYQVAVSKQGGPRSLSLATPKQVSLTRLESLVGDEPTPGMMSGRRQNTVLAEDCDEMGRLREDLDLMFIIHRPQPGDDAASMGPPVLRTDDGRRYSWAMMETRSVVHARPDAGDTVVSIGADVAFSKNWRQSRRWLFVGNSGRLLGTMDTLGVCIDLDARRAMGMPDDVMAAVARNALPDLA